jgi:hypothetical protein
MTWTVTWAQGANFQFMVVFNGGGLPRVLEYSRTDGAVEVFVVRLPYRLHYDSADGVGRAGAARQHRGGAQHPVSADDAGWQSLRASCVALPYVRRREVLDHSCVAMRR